LEDVQDGLDLKLKHGELAGTVKASPLLDPVFGFALVIVALAVPLQVIAMLANLIAMLNVNPTEADPVMGEGGDTAHGKPCPAILFVQTAPPPKDAAVIENTPFVRVQVVLLALHGKGPTKVTVIGPEKVTLPLDTQALPFHICQLAADAEKVAKEPVANKMTRSIALSDFIHILLM
jgi:hypothetical protein